MLPPHSSTVLAFAGPSRQILKVRDVHSMPLLSTDLTIIVIFDTVTCSFAHDKDQFNPGLHQTSTHQLEYVVDDNRWTGTMNTMSDNIFNLDCISHNLILFD